MSTRIRSDSVMRMRPRYSSRGRSTSALVTVTVSDYVGSASLLVVDTVMFASGMD